MTTKQIKKLTEALEQIADYDAAAEGDYTDVTFGGACSPPQRPDHEAAAKRQFGKLFGEAPQP